MAGSRALHSEMTVLSHIRARHKESRDKSSAYCRRLRFVVYVVETIIPNESSDCATKKNAQGRQLSTRARHPFDMIK